MASVPADTPTVFSTTFDVSGAGSEGPAYEGRIINRFPQEHRPGSATPNPVSGDAVSRGSHPSQSKTTAKRTTPVEAAMAFPRGRERTRLNHEEHEDPQKTPQRFLTHRKARCAFKVGETRVEECNASWFLRGSWCPLCFKTHPPNPTDRQAEGHEIDQVPRGPLRTLRSGSSFKRYETLDTRPGRD